jgi:uncharacterized transporter YbjL
MLSGAVLAHHSKLTSGRVRDAFSWVAETRVLRRMRTIGCLLALAGIGLDLGLFVASVRHTNLQLHERITLSGLAQSMLLAGTLLAVFSVLYGVIATSRVGHVRAEGCAPQCDS